VTYERRVVIVGGGFGGVRAALDLANKSEVSVRLVTPDKFFDYHSALYRSATGRSPLEVAIPLADFFEFATNVEVVRDRAAQLDDQQQQLHGESGAVYHYDELILALGNTTDYYNIPGLKQYSFSVKGIHDALRLKRHLHQRLIDGEVEHTYAIVGAGATGVELAAEMVPYLRRIRRKHGLSGDDFHVVLIEAGPQVLGAMLPEFAQRVQQRLKKLGVTLLLSTAVEGETAEQLRLPEQIIRSRTVIWTAGVTNSQFFTDNHQFELGKLNRVEVDEHLRALDHVYVIGDSAATRYTGMAQTALHDAKFVASDILHRQRGKQPQPYEPERPIYAIPVGPRWAAVLWGKTTIYGFLGFILRRLADLRLYLRFLPFLKALTTWQYGFKDDEACEVCGQ